MPNISLPPRYWTWPGTMPGATPTTLLPGSQTEPRVRWRRMATAGVPVKVKRRGCRTFSAPFSSRVTK